MSELSKGHTYNPGDIVDAADLNSLVDAGTALKGIIMDQPSATPDRVNDSLLIHDASAGTGGDLARCKIQDLGGGTVTGVTAVIDTGASVLAFTVNNSIPAVPALHLGLDSQLGNKVLASPDGSSGTPAFRKLVPADTESLRTIPGTYIIDCSLGSAFSLALTANTTLSLQNGIAGQTITVWLRQDSTIRTLAWTAPGGTIVWRGGTVPVIAATTNWVDIYTFFCTGTTYFGKADEDFH